MTSRTKTASGATQGPSLDSGVELEAGEADSDSDRDDAVGEQPGAVIAHFVVLELIGQGGMGRVLAAYDPTLDRKVAIKLIRSPRGPRAARLRDRLLNEARAMAKLSHPNVVTVHEVGTFRDDVYVAMEYVKGATLRDWLADESPSWKRVLRVFEQAGRGLAAAHAAGIVHRDFKPENVLLGEDGRVVVADFGLSRLADASPDAVPGSDDGPHGIGTTAEGTVVGTPAYMAPEQLAGGAIDAKADQFSFCVALYEALYGARPFADGTLDQRRHQVSRGQFSAPDKTSAVPARLWPLIRRGLAPQPADRHPSLDTLLEALTDDPVVRWKRRAGLVAFAALALTAIAAVAAWLDKPPLCPTDRRELAGAWDDSIDSALDASFASAGLIEPRDSAARVRRQLDSYADEWLSMQSDICRATRVRQVQSEKVFDQRMACLDRRRDELRALASELPTLEGPEEATRFTRIVAELTPVSACADVSALQSEIPMPDAPDARAEFSRLLTDLEQARTARLLGGYEKAQSIAENVASQARRMNFDAILAKSMIERVAIARPLRREVPPDASLARALALAARAGAPRLYAEALVDIVAHAVTDSPKRALDDAVRARHAIDLAGRPRRLLATLTYHEAEAHAALGKHETAQEKYGEALALLDGSDDAAKIGRANVLQGMANDRRLTGDPAQAEDLYRNVLEVWRDVLGERHLYVARTLDNLGVVLSDQQRFDDAIAHHREAAELVRSLFGENFHSEAFSHHSIGFAHLQRHELDEAEVAFSRALRIREAALPANHVLIGSTLGNLANIATQRGELDRAEELTQRALAINLERVGPHHRRTGNNYVGLAEIQMLRERCADVLPLTDKAMAAYAGEFGDADNWRFVFPLRQAGACHRDLGQVDRALQLLERAHRIAVETNVALPAMQTELGRTLWLAGRSRRRARELLWSGLTGLREGTDASAVAEAQQWLAEHQVPEAPGEAPVADPDTD